MSAGPVGATGGILTELSGTLAVTSAPKCFILTLAMRAARIRDTSTIMSGARAIVPCIAIRVPVALSRLRTLGDPPYVALVCGSEGDPCPNP